MALSSTITSTKRRADDDEHKDTEKRMKKGESVTSVLQEVDTSEWVQYDGFVLTNYDRKIVATGQRLTDQHMNYFQRLITEASVS